MALFKISQSSSPFPLGAHVKTNMGEGFVVGRNVSGDPGYSVRMMDGELRHSMPVAANEGMVLLQDIKLINATPYDHPMIPAGMRELFSRKRIAA